MAVTLRADVRPSRRALGIAAIVAALNVALFVMIAEDLFDGGGLIPHDGDVLHWFVHVRTQGWVDAAEVVSTLGGLAGLLVASVFVAGVLRVLGWSWQVAAAPACALLVAAAAAAVVKAAVGRERPPVPAHAAVVNSGSFPSAHATDAAACLLAISFVLALTVATRRRWQLLLVVGGLALAALVGLSRLVLGVHWLSDVVAGWALGNAISIIVVAAAWWWGAGGRPRPAGPRPRGGARE